MENEAMLAYAEVDAILDLLEEEYANKIPDKIRSFFKEEKIKEYKPKIDVDKPLLEQNLKRETIVLLAILNLNYWCNTEEEKKEILNEFAKNEKEKKELEERYNPDNLFKKRVSKNEENVQMVEYKEPNFIQKFINKIMEMFKRK